eukprot:4703771-Alexandrium_andersonii.AAC.1
MAEEATWSLREKEKVTEGDQPPMTHHESTTGRQAKPYVIVHDQPGSTASGDQHTRSWKGKGKG